MATLAKRLPRLVTGGSRAVGPSPGAESDALP
jgi:hypothetical protein